MTEDVSGHKQSGHYAVFFRRNNRIGFLVFGHHNRSRNIAAADIFRQRQFD